MSFLYLTKSPAGDSQILRLYTFGPLIRLEGTMAPLHYATKFDQFSLLGLRSYLHSGAIQGKEGIKFCHLATLVSCRLFSEYAHEHVFRLEFFSKNTQEYEYNRVP